jgi:hypothetical protein
MTSLKEEQTQKNVFKNGFLKFSSEDIQKQFDLYQNYYRKLLYIIITIVFGVACVIYIFYSWLVNLDLPILIISFALLLLILIILFFRSHIVVVFPIALSIMQFSFVVFSTEYFIPSRLRLFFDNNALFIVIGVSIAVLIMINVSVLQAWYHKSSLLVLSVEVVVLRTYGYKALVFFPLHVLLLLMPVIFFMQEKGQKLLFYEYEKQKQDLKGWKTLLDKHVPSSVFVSTFSTSTNNANNNANANTNNKNININNININNINSNNNTNNNTNSGYELDIKFANYTCLKEFGIDREKLPEKLNYLFAKKLARVSNTNNTQSFVLKPSPSRLH